MTGPLDNASVHFIDSIDAAAEFARWLGEQSIVAVDTETTGLAHTDRVRIAQVGNGDTAWVAPVELPRSWGGMLLSLLEPYRGEIIMHNAKFDLRMIENTLGHKFDLSRVHDTMMMARVLEPLRPASLKLLAARLVDSRAKIMDTQLNDAMDGGAHSWDTVPLTFEPYWFYAGLDTILTYHVYKELYPRVRAEAPLAYDLEMAAQHACRTIEDHGALVDHDRTRGAITELERYVDEATHWCTENFGVKPGSNDAIIDQLQRAGFEFTKLTKGGKIALDKEVLESVDHPLAQVILQRRRAEKIANTYLTHFLYDGDAEGRLHPNINSCQAKTSRMSMDSPNLQNLPRRSSGNPLGQLVRSCIVPAEGHVLLACDFAQIESRIFASLATAGTGLVEAFNQDDFFAAMAREIYVDPAIQKSDPRRQLTKNAMYARLYGAGASKFGLTAGVSFEEAQRFTALLDHTYPEMRLLQLKIEQVAHERHVSTGEAYITSPLTKRRWYLDTEAGDAYYKLVNYLIQGVASEVMKLKLAELAAIDVLQHVVTVVHDEVLMEVPLELVDDIEQATLGVMCDANLFRVPITAEPKRGESWGVLA